MTRDLDKAEKSFEEFLTHLGLDLKDPNLVDTPKRVTKMYAKELFAGLFDEEPSVTAFNLDQFTVTSDMMVVGPISLKSTCSHHFMPITGNVYIGIMNPESKTFLGLSKYARIVNYYARRPQIQEKLCAEIGEHIQKVLGIHTDQELPSDSGCAVIIKAKHFCMCHRGVNDDNSLMTSSYLTGVFKNPTVRAEFFSLIGLK